MASEKLITNEEEWAEQIAASTQNKLENLKPLEEVEQRTLDNKAADEVDYESGVEGEASEPAEASVED